MVDLPLIGLSMDQVEEDRRGKRFWLKETYVRAVCLAGGAPVLLPSLPEEGVINRYLNNLSGLIITGGDFDVPPSYYASKNDGRTRTLVPERSAFEFSLLKKAREKNLPVLGVCGGMQLMNVFCGGTLQQHVPNHEKLSHAIAIEKRSLLHQALKKESCTVNSTHHQAVGDLGKNLQACACAEDGVVEAIEWSQGSQKIFFLGVQWHPEAICDKAPEQLNIYRALVDAARSWGVKP